MDHYTKPIQGIQFRRFREMVMNLPVYLPMETTKYITQKKGRKSVLVPMHRSELVVILIFHIIDQLVIPNSLKLINSWIAHLEQKIWHIGEFLLSLSMNTTYNYIHSIITCFSSICIFIHVRSFWYHSILLI